MTFRKIIPNVFTAANLSSGFAAIFLLLFDGNVFWILLAMLFAILFDAIDGLSARLLKGQTSFGKQFDSMADMVSFGIVPSLFLLYTLLYSHDQNPRQDILVYSLPALVYLLSVAMRLAWFNTDDSQSVDFKGLASPAAALAMVTFIFFDAPWTNEEIIALVAILISAQMLVPVRVMSLKFTKSRLHLIFSIAIILISAAIVFFNGLQSLWIAVLIYYIAGIFMYQISSRLTKIKS